MTLFCTCSATSSLPLDCAPGFCIGPGRCQRLTLGARPHAPCRGDCKGQHPRDDDFCAAQGAPVRAARNTPSFEKLRCRALPVEACRVALTRPPRPQAPSAPPTPQRLFPLPPPPPAAPPTGILQNLRSWFENDEYATDTMRRPRLSPRPRLSARRSAGVELSTFAQRAASPVRLRSCAPARAGSWRKIRLPLV